MVRGTREDQRIRARGRVTAPGEKKREMRASKLIVSRSAKDARVSYHEFAGYATDNERAQ
jgi:hypothetical protein